MKSAERPKESDHRPPRLLWIKADQLHPLNSGGRIRTYNMLRALKTHFNVTYFCLGDSGDDAMTAMSEYSHEQHVITSTSDDGSRVREAIRLLFSVATSRLPFVIHKYTSRRIREALARVIQNGDFDIVVCDFLSLSANLLELPKREGVRYVVFQHNVESRIWERHYRTAHSFVWRQLYRMQWQRFKRFERDTCRWFDGVIAVSSADADDFSREFSLPNVLGHVETGVDIDYFSPRKAAPEQHNIVFLGSMDWMPNIDGIQDFVTECWPAVKRRVPSVKLTVVGRNPAPSVLRLAERDDDISVTGTVADVRPYLSEATLSIVPLRVGGGTRIKIYEAMAMGVPVVSTNVGAEGLPLVHRESIMLADDWDLLTDATVELINDRALAARIARSGSDLVRANYSWEVITRDFVEMLHALDSDQTLTYAADDTNARTT